MENTRNIMLQGDRVRQHTSEKTNQQLDREMEERVQCFAGQSIEAIEQRLEQLNQEWDIERWLEMNASALAFLGVSLGFTVNKKWLLLPAIVLPFLFQHAIQGWCPPVPVLRRLGVRTQHEIDTEKQALLSLLEKKTVSAME